MVNNGSPFTSCPAEEDITSPTLDPELIQLPPTPCTEPMPEPTADMEPKPAASSKSPLVPPSSKSPVSPKILSSLPLPPPPLITASSSAPSPLVPFSTLTLPMTLSSFALARGSPGYASSHRARHSTSDRRLHLGSSLPLAPPGTVVLTAAPGSLVPPGRPWSVVTLP
ncbi:hypothetical protein PO909_017990 [Leuciscus waleckii]